MHKKYELDSCKPEIFLQFPNANINFEIEDAYTLKITSSLIFQIQRRPFFFMPYFDFLWMPVLVIQNSKMAKSYTAKFDDRNELQIHITKLLTILIKKKINK